MIQGKMSEKWGSYSFP